MILMIIRKYIVPTDQNMVWGLACQLEKLDSYPMGHSLPKEIIFIPTQCGATTLGTKLKLIDLQREDHCFDVNQYMIG